MTRYDAIVFGCTGNAGRATSLYTIKFAKGRKVALAGRNESRVIALKKSVCDELKAPGNDIGVVVADSTDPTSMLAMAKATKVLIACAGPFGRYGEAAVAACVEAGCHYVDITGEVPWVNAMINKYGAAAKEKNVSIISFGGYDCVPAELAMVLSGEALKAQGGMGSLNMVFSGKGGGFPKGTLNTILDMAEAKNPARGDRDQSYVPAAFKNAHKDATGLFRWILPQWHTETSEFTAQNFMSGINTPVICRGAAELGLQPFAIRDRLRMAGGSGFKKALTLFGLLPFVAFQVGGICGGALLSIPMFRSWLRTRLQTYNFAGAAKGNVRCNANAMSKDGTSTVNVKISCDGDPGIYATGRFAASVAWALVTADSSGKGDEVLKGFHAPVTALHSSAVLYEVLEKNGVTMKVTKTVNGEESEVLNPTSKM